METPWTTTISVSEETEGLKSERYARKIERAVHFLLQMDRRRVPWRGIGEKEIPASILRTCASETEKVGV